MNEGYIKIVKNLNDTLFEKIGKKNHSKLGWGFKYCTNGYEHCIEFNGMILWNSEDEERFFDEDKNENEPLEPFIWEQLRKYIDNLNKFL